MSRILKSINFLSSHSVTLEAAGFETPRAAKLNQDEFLVAASTPDPNQNEALIADTTSADLLQEAQKHVEMMLSQAQVQVTTWQEEARQEGWEAGYAQARQVVEAELTEALASARRLAESVVEAHDQFLRDNQAEIGRLAVAIAEKIIGKELALNPKTITDIVATTIQTANIRGACRIRVNPNDYEIIEPYWNAVPSLQPPGHVWELMPDPRIRQGGCLIEVGGGTIDAQLETQLEQVAIALQF